MNCLSRRGGLHDYDDAAYLNWTVNHPNDDWTPFDMLWAVDKDFVCEPGACGEYASPGYAHPAKRCPLTSAQTDRHTPHRTTGAHAQRHVQHQQQILLSLCLLDDVTFLLLPLLPLSCHSYTRVLHTETAFPLRHNHVISRLHSATRPSLETGS